VKPKDQRTAEGILFTDQYQFTMAQLYYRMGLHEKPVQFDHFFRDYPDYGAHQAGYCITAGLEWLLDWMQEAHFRDADVAYLRGQTGRTGEPIFTPDFLRWLRRNGTFEGLSMGAIPEGRVVHPNVPLTVVQGPLAMAQILETSLLNHLNYQTLIATKAARIHDSGRGQLLLEFGLRRGHERGANAGARAALIGGADFSSNVGVSHVLGYPPKGTHAHSMVQVFMTLGMSELDAFRAYADVYPDDCLLLVDTINSLESGIPNAIQVFEELRRRGHEPVGIRLDSGDLAYLSIQAARMLDELIGRLVYGVGTRLITSWGEPALGGVYKLVAVRDKGEWQPAIKVSESAAKTPNPGHKRVWRIYDQRGKATADLLSLEGEDPRSEARLVLHHPADHSRYRILERQGISKIEPLLVEVLREGRLVYDLPTLEQIREQRKADVRRLDPGVRRLVNPHIYHVSLTQRLWDLKQTLVRSAIEKSH